MPDGAAHIFPIRVYYEDTDAQGIVYYANYLKFAERARTEYLRELGTDHTRLMAEEGLGFTVRNCNIDYLKPARLDDSLQVHTRFRDPRGATLSADQEVRRDEEALACMVLRLACVDRRGHPRRLPLDFRAAISGNAAPERVGRHKKTKRNA